MTVTPFCTRPPRTFRLALAGLLAFTVTAQAGPLDDARVAWESGDLREAVIRLKDRIQRDPNDAAAHLLLAEVHLDAGEAAAAEREAERALKLDGADRAAAQLARARALLVQSKLDALLAGTPGEEDFPADARASLEALRGDALLNKGDPEAAGLAYARALSLEPKQPVALLGHAKLAMRQEWVERTQEHLDAAIQANPGDVDTRLLAGDYAYLRGRFDLAEAQYSAAMDAKRKVWLARYKRALVRIELGQLAEAKDDLDAAKRMVPGFAGLYYGRGLVAFKEDRPADAYAQLETYLKAFPKDRNGAFYAAAALYKLKRYAQAEEYLSRVLSAEPNLAAAANLLAVVRLESNRPAGAEEVLAPLVRGERPGAETLRLYAQALQAQGRISEAQVYLERAKAAAPEDRGARLALAAGYLQDGKADAAVQEARGLLSDSPGDPKANLVLIKGLMDQRDKAGALKAAEAFVAEAPARADAYHALGIAQNAAGDRSAARQSFVTARERDPRHTDSTLALAALEIELGRREEARRLYEQALAVPPTDARVLLKLVQLDVSEGQTDAAIKRLREALASNPTSLDLRINLALGLQAAGQAEAAAVVVAQAPAEVAEDPSLMMLGAELDLQAGRAFSAVSTLEDLVAKHPSWADGRYLLAIAFAAVSNLTFMEEQLQAGVSLDHNSPMASKALAAVYGKLKDPAAKRALLESLKAPGRDLNGLALMEARLAIDEGQIQRAKEQLVALHQRLPNDRAVLIELLGVQTSSGDIDSATSTATAWATKHPEDYQVRRNLAQYYVQSQRPHKAIETYRELIRERPADAIANNNLAELLLQSDPRAALAHAQTAHEAAPDKPAIADTLGQALLASGDARGAAEMLAGAYAALPGDPSVALHYASALAAVGDAAKARAVLLPVIEKAFPEKTKAQALLKILTAE